MTSLYVFVGEHSQSAVKTLPPGAVVYLIGFDADLEGFDRANCQDRLHEVARDCSDWFVKYCEDRDLFEHGGATNGFDPNFFQEHRSKRVDLYKTFHIFCNGRLLNSLATEGRFTDIYIYGATEHEFAYLDAVIDHRCHHRNGIKNESPLKYTPGIMRFLLSFIGLYLITVPIRIIFKFQHLLGIHPTGGKWFFSIWPITFLEDQSTDRIYGELNDGSLRIISLFADGIHQKTSVRQYFQFKHSHLPSGSIVLEDHLCLADLLHLLIAVFKAIAGLGLKARRCVDAVDLLFYQEDLASRFRVPRLLIFYRLFDRFVRWHKPQELHYHLFEYPLGKVISFSASDQNCWRVGYQHGPAAELKLLCRDASGDSRLHPDLILVEDAFSHTIYAKGWPTRVVVRDRVPRLQYLDGVTRKKVSNTVLFALPQHNFHSLVLMANEMAVTSDKSILIKPHPRSYFDTTSTPLEVGIEITAKPISVLYENVGFIYSTYSSVIHEALKLEIPCKVVAIPGLVDLGVTNETHK